MPKDRADSADGHVIPEQTCQSMLGPNDEVWLAFPIMQQTLWVNVSLGH